MSAGGFLSLLDSARRQVLEENDYQYAQTIAKSLETQARDAELEQIKRDSELARAAAAAGLSPAKIIIGDSMHSRLVASKRDEGSGAATAIPDSVLPCDTASAAATAASMTIRRFHAVTDDSRAEEHLVVERFVDRRAADGSSGTAVPKHESLTPGADEHHHIDIPDEEDRAFIMAVAAAGAAEVRDELHRIADAWRQPDIVARNVDDGIVISMVLPSLDRHSMRIRIDPATKDAVQEICVTAQPKLSHINAMLPYLPADMRTEALAITLDLKIIGKERCNEDDIGLGFKGDRCMVTIRNAYLRDKPTSSPVKIHGVCK